MLRVMCQHRQPSVALRVPSQHMPGSRRLQNSSIVRSTLQETVLAVKMRADQTLQMS